ncbi:MAG: amidohydrolase [Haloferacaceae archaeon]
MTAPADLVVTDGTVHTLADPDRTHGAVAVRDGRIVRLGDAYDVAFLIGTETRVVECGGGVVLPGFVDAHTHLDALGARLVHADLSTAATREEALALLSVRAAEVDPGRWVLGYGYDESAWPEDERRPLTRDDLDGVAHRGPVAAVREDMHLVSVDSTALDALGALPAGVRREDGEPTGVLVEAAAGAVFDATAPDRAEARDRLRAATDHAVARGVTAVHDVVSNPAVARAHRDLALAGDLPLRVRIQYHRDRLDAVEATGLATNAGDRVRTGAIKAFADGSLGARTARLSTPYADAPAERGEWTTAPDDLAALVGRIDDLGLQAAVHAIGDEAVDAVLDAYAAVVGDDAADDAHTDDAADGGAEASAGGDGPRHRIEHAELASDDAIDRMADLGVVASVQPNFLRWAGEDGLYADRLGDRRPTNRLRAFADAGVPLAFGSDCMPLDPLVGVHHAVTAPDPAQRLGVTAALRAYTRGAAYAGFDEDRLGTVERGTRADLVVLDRSPWDHPDAIDDVEVLATVVDGEVVHAADETRM